MFVSRFDAVDLYTRRSILGDVFCYDLETVLFLSLDFFVTISAMEMQLVSFASVRCFCCDDM